MKGLLIFVLVVGTFCLTAYVAYHFFLNKDRQGLEETNQNLAAGQLPTLVTFWSPHWYRTYTPFGLIARLLGKHESVVLTHNSATEAFTITPEALTVKVSKSNVVPKADIASCTVQPHWFYGAYRTSLKITLDNKAVYTVVFADAVTEEVLTETLSENGYQCT